MDEPLIERVRSAIEEVFNDRDLSRINDETFSPEFVNRNAVEGTPAGPEGQRQVMQRLWTAFPDARFEVEEIAADGKTVLCVGTMSGTHEGELSGIPPTGRKVSWRQCHLLTVDDEGRFVDHDAIRDDLGLLRQLGVVPGAGAS
jgi:predicted ester cyclase